MGDVEKFEALEIAAGLHAGGPAKFLINRAAEIRDEAWGNVITYSPKVFIPLTMLCRDVCHYCTFARPPLPGRNAFMTREEVLQVAAQGTRAGCTEALFTLGDKPEKRYKLARRELERLGHETTLGYLAEMAQGVLDEAGLLPHLNPGVMDPDDLLKLRRVAPSMGLMLESSSRRLMEKGGVHYGSPDKEPALRLAFIEEAGRQRIPLTTGILIGIGESWQERAQTLLEIEGMHRRFGHIQEVIVQNFRAKSGTLMAASREPSLEEMIATIALARLILSPEVSIQAPPNLAGSLDECSKYIAAGVNDWGGVSPVTKDFVNPEAPWPSIEGLRNMTEASGFLLAPRLTVYPRYAFQEQWVDPKVRPFVLHLADTAGLARDQSWSPGAQAPPRDVFSTPFFWNRTSGIRPRPSFERALGKVTEGQELGEDEVTALFSARGPEQQRLFAAADSVRRSVSGDTVTFVVNRNINYTNMCYFKCGFCAFSKGPKSLNLRGEPYLLDLEEVANRAVEAGQRGATEVCLQGGIHPSFTGDFYVDVVKSIKASVPSMHVHAFSPLEVWQGAETKGVTLKDFLWELKDAGLNSLPGTAAEILDDEVRAVICPDKISTAQWSLVATTAHSLGLPMTSTIMFGHVEGHRAWARHLLVLRDIQKKTGGFTEFVPLPFVHMAAPIYLKGRARRGPTLEESLLMHAVARLVLHPWISNIQTSWVKMGLRGAQMALQAGCNDLGGTLMNEIISRSAGANHGQEVTPSEMMRLASEIGRPYAQRNTLYGMLDSPQNIQALSYDGAVTTN